MYCFPVGDKGEFKNVEFVDGSKKCEVGQVVRHDKRAKAGGPGTLGYVEPGDFRDVIMVPPLSNITVIKMKYF